MAAKRSVASPIRAVRAEEVATRPPRAAETREEPASLAELIRASLADAPSAERKVARALLGHYPAAGLEPASRLADRAGASAPTVVRYVAKLGFGGYREFQDALRKEIQARGAGYPALPSRYTKATPTARLRADAAKAFELTLNDTFAGLPDAELERAIELLADIRHRVTLVGGRVSHLLAQYLHWHLGLMRPGTSVLAGGFADWSSLLVDIGRRDLAVIFDFRRYQQDVVQFAHEAADRHARIVLITDPWLSPAAEVADVVLPVRVEAPSPFDSLAPAVAVTETIVAGVLAKLGDEAETRMRLCDELAGLATVR